MAGVATGATGSGGRGDGGDQGADGAFPERDGAGADEIRWAEDVGGTAGPPGTGPRAHGVDPSSRADPDAAVRRDREPLPRPACHFAEPRVEGHESLGPTRDEESVPRGTQPRREVAEPVEAGEFLTGDRVHDREPPFAGPAVAGAHHIEE